MHIATDRNGVIKKVIATTTSAHESTQFDKLIEDEKREKRDYEQEWIFNGIAKRRVRGQSKPRIKQSKNNKRFAKLRGLVELPFAFIKHHMNFRTCRYLGLEKNQEHFNLIAACVNLKRAPQLIKRYG